MHLRQAVRRSLRRPGFALTVLVLVAAAVAVNATIFGALHALTWKALPYHQADRLVEMRSDMRAFNVQLGLNQWLYRQIRADDGQFAGAVGHRVVAPHASIDEAGQPWRIQRVTADFTRVLGVMPVLGRDFGDDDSTVANDLSLLLTDRAWRSRFGGDTGVLGQRLRIGADEHTIIGVLPPGFAFPDGEVEAFRPFVLATDNGEDGGVGSMNVVARLAEGANVDGARAWLDAAILHDDALAISRERTGLVGDVRLLRDGFAAEHWQSLLLLQVAALLLLAVVAANLANLVLDRLIARRREFAICRALGARDGDVLRSVLADLVPAVAAGMAVGLHLVPTGIAFLRSRELLPEHPVVTTGNDPVTGLAVVATVGLAIATAVLVALLALARDRGGIGLRERSATAGLGRARAVMLAAQIALTTALVGGAGLLLRSAINLINEDRGFDATGVVLTGVELRGAATQMPTEAERERMIAQVEPLRAAVAALPGVERVAVASMPPFGGWDFLGSIPSPEGEPISVRFNAVGPGYFAALGIPLLAGRDFRSDDTEAAGVMIVDETYRQRYLADVDPLTATVPRMADGGQRDVAIIGVAKAVKQKRLDEANDVPVLYSLSTGSVPNFFLVTRTTLAPAAMVDTVRALIREQLPDAYVPVNVPLGEAVARTLISRRALLEAIALFAGLTLLLATLGLYAVLNVSVRRRTSELGVRIALGADSARILRLVMAQGGALTVVGIAIGLTLGVMSAHLVADRLYRLTPGDPLTWSATTVAIALAALLACWLPARRATRLPPTVALRSE